MKEDIHQIKFNFSHCEICNKHMNFSLYIYHYDYCKQIQQFSAKNISQPKITALQSNQNQTIICSKQSSNALYDQISYENQNTSRNIKCQYCDVQLINNMIQEHECFQHHNGELNNQFQNIFDFINEINQNSYSIDQENSESLTRQQQQQQSQARYFTLFNPYQIFIQFYQTNSNLLQNIFEEQYEGLTEKQISELIQINYTINKQKDTCTICYNNFDHNQNIIKLKCSHLFHIQCIKAWLQKKSKCPNCKTDMKQGEN